MFCRPFGPGSFFLCGSRGSVLRCASHSPLATLFRAFGAPRTISPAFHNLPVALFRAFGAPRNISPAFHNLPVAFFRAFGAHIIERTSIDRTHIVERASITETNPQRSPALNLTLLTTSLSMTTRCGRCLRRVPC